MSDRPEPSGPDRLPLRSRLVRAARLATRHRRDLARSMWWLPVVAVSLRRSGHRATARRLAARREHPMTDPGPAGPGEHPSASDGETRSVELAREVAFVVRLAARALPDATCLRTALVLQHLLARHGVGATVRVGVRPGTLDPDLSFHAWVEVAGQPVSEPAHLLQGYIVLSEGATGPDHRGRSEDLPSIDPP